MEIRGNRCGKIVWDVFSNLPDKELEKRGTHYRGNGVWDDFLINLPDKEWESWEECVG